MKNTNKTQVVGDKILDRIAEELEGADSIKDLDTQGIADLAKAYSTLEPKDEVDNCGIEAEAKLNEAQAVKAQMEANKHDVDISKIVTTGMVCGTVLLMYATGIEFEKEGNLNPIKGVQSVFGLAKGLF